MASLSSQPSKKGIRTNAAGGNSSGNNQGKGNSTGQTVKFARRTSSGRYVNLSSENLDLSGELNNDYMNYSVQTPDHQPMDPALPTKAEEQYVSSSLFTGGFNSVTRAHLMDKVIDSKVNHPQMAGSKGSSCGMPACDGKVMKDERGNDILPCECRFKICRDCLMDTQKESGLCPGCKEPYRGADYDDDDCVRETPLSLPAPHGSRVDRHGYGSNSWRDDYGGDEGGASRSMLGDDRSWMPLSRRIPVPRKIIVPYRLLIILRLIAMGFYFQWRIRHQNVDAVWLWYMSVVCELWFGFSWILDQIPKLRPINRATYLEVLRDKFDMPSPSNPTGHSDLPGVDLFVATVDPTKEPSLVTANTILSILAVDYPVEKLACYVSDDGAHLLTFEAMAEAASFADLWVPFCRKHEIEPRNPESYFNLHGDPTKNKSRSDFVKDRRRVKREYDEFKVRINGLTDSIRRRSDAFNAREEMKMMKQMKEKVGPNVLDIEPVKPPKATWMADGSHWPGAWVIGASEHAKGDHESILQVMLKPPSHDPLMGSSENALDFTDVDIRLPMFVYVSREKRAGYDSNEKAGALNALLRSSAVLSNGPFVLNLDCDHYIFDSQVLREGMCFMMDQGGEDISFIQFPQRFEGVDPSDRYANHNNVFYDGNMRALDGAQGPVYVGTGCLFKRFALYGFDPPQVDKIIKQKETDTAVEKYNFTEFEPRLDHNMLPKRFGNSLMLVQSIMISEYQGRPLADYKTVKYGRPPGLLREPREMLDSTTVIEAVTVISSWYEDKTMWGSQVGWIYGSSKEDLVTGYRMHNQGWRSVYCLTKRDAFRGSAPINLTDRLHQVLRWATGSIEIYFSRYNAIIGSTRLKFLQRIGYLNLCIYPFSSVFIACYCFLPFLSLISGQFIVQRINIALLVYCLVIFICIIAMAVLEVKWSGVPLEQWWRNEQFWIISGLSSHLAAVVLGLLKVIAGINCTTASRVKPGGEDEDGEKFGDLYMVKWTYLMILPIVVAMTIIVGIVVALTRAIYSENPKWSKLLGGFFFSFWVLSHLYPFAKGLMGKKRRTPTIVFVWAGLVTITLSLLWVAISPPHDDSDSDTIVTNTYEWP